MTCDGVFTRRWVRWFAESVSRTEPELTDLDRRVGDGDFGTNLLVGLATTIRVLDRSPVTAGESRAADPLEVMAGVFLDEVGGTSGPLFGLVFQELAASARAAGPTLTGAAVEQGIGAGLAAVRRVGEAEPGDKTMVDALLPALTEVRRAGPLPAERALALAARGARRGVSETARLRARRGRAGYLGDRVTGVPDPGAVGVAVLFASAAGPVTALAPWWESGVSRAHVPVTRLDGPESDTGTGTGAGVPAGR
ncbi:dihydroxyacetone kinase subunit DhaL [Streptomyces calidiresistens]|uniref:Dihydroxyacetone kinase subunit L n=1 Tax=Streptomyces calidiresistens TaxID=1485586 RepID=A0A7W3T312_9ACTN|nr:dihydroxyacetone kinase subunit DhaL [Streptomyces calidiresistens]MBB0230020.1 dihydroxyacetone kinase subunit L [Streptomyces calidiresistens]